MTGTQLKAVRLFGPQPLAKTYLCLWEASVPEISAFASPAFLQTLSAVGRAVGYNFSDKGNAPTPRLAPPEEPDGEEYQSLNRC